MKNSNSEVESKFFKIQENGVGLDLTHLNYCPESSVLENFKYIHTSTDCVNDNILANFIDQDVKTLQLVTEISCVTRMGQVLLSHLSALDLDWVDILEVPADCDWSEDTVDQLKNLVDSGLVYEISIKNPKTVDRIEEIKQLLSEKSLYISYVSLDICPLNFNLDIVEWCKKEENDIDLIGYNPIGGYINHPNLLNSFSAPYLLGFAATYCSIVFLSSRDLYKSIQSAKYLKELHNEFSDSMYVLKKTVNKLQRPLKKVVYTSTILGTNVSIPYETPDFVPTDEDSILINLGKPLESLPIVDEYNDPYTEFEKEINEFLSSLSYPIDASEKTKFCLAKNQIINYIRTKYPGYDILCSMINDTTIAVMATSEGVSGNWFKRTKVTYTNSYLIAMKLDGTAYFKECK